jgi:hypothetical protein
MGLGKTSIKLRGAEVGIEAIMLGCVTSIGGFLFGKFGLSICSGVSCSPANRLRYRSDLEYVALQGLQTPFRTVPEP